MWLRFCGNTPQTSGVAVGEAGAQGHFARRASPEATAPDTAGHVAVPGWLNACWVPGTSDKQDLIVTLDDATDHITSIFLTQQEGILSSFTGLAQTIARHGLFGVFYTERGSRYFLSPEAGGGVDKENLTQVGR